MWPQPPQSSSSSLPLTNYETSSTTLQAHILQELEEEENEGGDGLENELKVVYAALDPQDFLALLLDYLKTTHTYCLYCACDYDTLEQLDKECPGSRDNH